MTKHKNKKLSLGRETIQTLTAAQLRSIGGGGDTDNCNSTGCGGGGSSGSPICDLGTWPVVIKRLTDRE